MQVAICIRRAIIVNDNINSFNIDASTENISSNKNALLECFESGIATNSRKKKIIVNIVNESIPIFRTVLPVGVPNGC